MESFTRCFGCIRKFCSGIRLSILLKILAFIVNAGSD